MAGTTLGAFDIVPLGVELAPVGLKLFYRVVHLWSVFNALPVVSVGLNTPPLHTHTLHPSKHTHIHPESENQQLACSCTSSSCQS